MRHHEPTHALSSRRTTLAGLPCGQLLQYCVAPNNRLVRIASRPAPQAAYGAGMIYTVQETLVGSVTGVIVKGLTVSVGSGGSGGSTSSGSSFCV